MSIVVLVMWASGLQLAGPLRTIFVGMHYDFVLAGIFAAFCVGKNNEKFLFITRLNMFFMYAGAVAVVYYMRNITLQ